MNSRHLKWVCLTIELEHKLITFIIILNHNTDRIYW